MSTIQLSRGTFSKKFLTALAVAFLFSTVGSTKAIAGVWAVNVTHDVSESQQQAIILKGTVTDSNGEPVIGASITEKGSPKNGTVTDIDGHFSLKLKPNATLIVSYIGFQKQEVAVNGKTSITVVLKENAELLEEVVVVGYGTQKKENLTGAVASVDIDKSLKNRPIADVGRGLQGTIPGLSVTVGNGEIGSDPTMKIRGQLASINGTSSPLILLDNVEIPSIQMVNPDDIESISVLKDAAASSIYGAKAAFGVVLITTKKGAKNESVNIQYSTNFSWQNVAKDIKMGGIDALDYTVNAFERVGSSIAGAFWYVTRESYEKSVLWQQKYGGTVKANDPMVYGRDWYVDSSNRKIGVRTYDPYNYMVREWTPSQTQNLSISGKSGKTAYNIGLGYLDQTGMMKPAKHDDFKRYNASLRLSTDINKYLTVKAGMIYSKREKRYAYVTNSTTADPWLYLYRWGPLYPLTTEDGDPIRSPVSEAQQANTASQKYNYTNVNIGATIHLTKDWTVDADFTHASQEFTWNRPGTIYTAKNAWGGAAAKLDANGNRIYVDDSGQVVDASATGAMPAYQLSNVTYTSTGSNPDHIYRNSENMEQETANVYTTYNFKLDENNVFKAMGGINRVTQKTVNNWSQITQLLDISNPQFDLATGTQTAGGQVYWESQLGYYGRLNYALMDKYLFEANLRYDGSSKFPTNLSWRWFPSFSAGWRASEEKFMEWAKPTLSSLKMRGSWGTIGDQTVPNSMYVSTMGVSNTSWLDGSTKFVSVGTPSVVVPSITWQDIETLDLGVDLRMFNNELGVSFDWYQRTTKNMIVAGAAVANTFGTSAPNGNFGELRTRGWELAVDYNHRFSNGIGVNATATLADATTIITKYAPLAVKTVSNTYYEGKRYGDIWGYKTDRLYQYSDFELGSDGKPQLITLTADESAKYAGKKAYKLKTVDGKKPVYQPYLQNSSNFYFGPGDVKFVDLNGDGEINNGSNTTDDHGDLSVIGNSTPRYEYGLRLGADWKGFDCSIFFQGVGKRQIWGSGFLAIPGYNSSDGAMPQTFAGDFWKDDRTDAFYPRAYNQGGSDNTNNMQVQSRYLLDMSYMRIKNMTLGYSLPQDLLKKAAISKARVYIALENFFTFDHLRDLPIDPEAVSGYSMFNSSNYNSGRTGVGTPMFKSVSFGLQLNF
jgi:TonB-linked outer membrane protein, SusC/RagA family